MCVCVCECAYACMFVHRNVCVCALCVCMCMWVYVFVHVSLCECVCECVNVLVLGWEDCSYMDTTLFLPPSFPQLFFKLLFLWTTHPPSLQLQGYLSVSHSTVILASTDKRQESMMLLFVALSNSLHKTTDKGCFLQCFARQRTANLMWTATCS